MKAFTVLACSALLGAALLIPAASPAVHLQPGACANPTIVADNEGDTVRGTDGPDVIQGGNGPDVIYGLRGDDRICGNNSADTIYGNRGDDSLQGNHGADRLFGDPGHDHANGGGTGAQDFCLAEEEVNCDV
jgi:Ca2+-binding RTX toxin-like protein